MQINGASRQRDDQRVRLQRLGIVFVALLYPGRVANFRDCLSRGIVPNEFSSGASTGFQHAPRMRRMKIWGPRRAYPFVAPAVRPEM
jgi:hypothetical protein